MLAKDCIESVLDSKGDSNSDSTARLCRDCYVFVMAYLSTKLLVRLQNRDSYKC